MASVNPMKLLQAKAALDQFLQAHPKLPQFFKAVGENALEEGTVLECNVTTADGRRYAANFKLTQQDMELIKELKEWKE